MFLYQLHYYIVGHSSVEGLVPYMHIAHYQTRPIYLSHMHRATVCPRVYENCFHQAKIEGTGPTIICVTSFLET